MEALGALAVLYMHHTNPPDADDAAARRARAVRDGMQLLQQAYEVNQNAPMVLNHLADVRFRQWNRSMAVDDTPISVRYQPMGVRLITSARPMEVQPGDVLMVENTQVTVSSAPNAVQDGLILLQEPVVIVDRNNNKIEDADRDLALATRGFRQSLQLACEAVKHTRNPRILAESFYLQARAEHALGRSRYINAKLHVRVFCVPPVSLCLCVSASASVSVSVSVALSLCVFASLLFPLHLVVACASTNARRSWHRISLCRCTGTLKCIWRLVSLKAARRL